MTTTRPSLRVETPVLEPDDALVARLATGARLSHAPVPRRRRLGDWRVALVAVAIAVFTTGAAYAAGVIGPLNQPHPSHQPTRPYEETEPVPASSGDGDRGSSVTEPPVGRPTDLPTEGTRGPTDRPTGPPSGVPSGPPSDPPSGHPTGAPSGLPTPDHPTGQPSSPGRPSGLPSATPAKGPNAHPAKPTGLPTPVRLSLQGGP